MIKVRATTPKEIEVTIKLDQRSAQILLGILGDLPGCDHKIDGVNDNEVDDVLLSIRGGLEGEGITLEYLDGGDDL